MMKDCLNMKNTVVKDAIERDGKKVYVPNQTETEFAQEKQRQLQETFKSWIFADAVRREEVVETSPPTPPISMPRTNSVARTSRLRHRSSTG